MNRLIRTAFITGTLSLAAAAAQATSMTYSFDCITNNNPANCAAGEAQLFVTVSNDAVPESNDVDFIFNNLGPVASSIADVYFDDGSLMGITTIINGMGVTFSQGASPPNLPGGASISPPFVTTMGFSADSDPPVQPNGVNPGEQLIIRFDLLAGKAYSDVIDALGSGSLRIGIHVQGLPAEGSESFVNDGLVPPLQVPEPGVLIVMGAGLAGLGWLRRRRDLTGA